MTTPVLFLDDASRHIDTIDRASAEHTARTLISTLRHLRNINNKIALNTARRIADYEIANGWTLQAVLRGNTFREEWDFIRELSARSPFSKGQEVLLSQAIDNMEVRTRPGEVLSSALAWAILLDSATVSFAAHPDWSRGWVEISCKELDGDAEIVESTDSVRNASQPAHANEHADWLRSLGLSDVSTAAQLWSERGDHFKGLRFLPRVERDLSNLEGSGAVFLQAVNSLQALSQDAMDWEKNKEQWPSFSRHASPESDTRRELCWVHDDATGNRELFDWHTRFTGQFAGRVHFRVDAKNRVIVVAYVGAKLTRKISG